MRQLAFAFAEQTATRPQSYDPEHFQQMEDFLAFIAAAGAMDTDLVLDSLEVDSDQRPKPPLVFARITPNHTIQVDPTIFEYPIGISVAIYPNLDRPASLTPLFWTRGLQQFRSFDKPYLGHVAFLDGHIETFGGEPDAHDPALLQLFPNDNGSPTEAVRTLESIPRNSTARNAQPLPTHLPELIKQRQEDWQRRRMIRGWILFTLPALIGGFLAGYVKKGPLSEKLSRATSVALTIGILTLIVISI
ncbi:MULTISPECIES: hypothetical protein [unclassified Lentimonas]|uniref:hypothetical protein n=1 Tax=unclassified Lentimonas TaxID=2630993 RepID=UPI001389FFE4|nr:MULTISPECIES: hypothetical protein [unclassified Lentimonas]